MFNISNNFFSDSKLRVFNYWDYTKQGGLGKLSNITAIEIIFKRFFIIPSYPSKCKITESKAVGKNK